MAELDKILTDVACAIVDDPSSVKVVREDNGDDVNLTLTVAENDMGKVIGRHGRIAKAIRAVVKAAANKAGKKVTVEIR